MSTRLAAQRVWETVGWLMLATVVILSLVHIEQPLDVRHADKYEHLLAYGSLMYWWGMVQPGSRVKWAIALPLVGLALEYAQTFTAHRVLEWNDALANTGGVLIGLMLLATPAAALLAGVDRKLADRVNSRVA